ncbi:winged helix-turn-helix transcriptional regulator [Candidatus Uhrbacteria bacterium]|jgi:HTH-type transcriptional regulator, sugar sensing transcriptional regulator|nr:winged helix-turn-helix transcriptional regulator [Candidatus Uhrbacteria bacterium]MBT7717012.1 winged helix-turn-helix transcriptional regulator [Candidatus Uhrbacteria bacterium]
MKNKAIITNAELELIGLNQRDLDVYLALAKLGSAPLRRVAEISKISRSTVHDVLRRLIDLELVSFVDGSSHRYFTAEDPKQLRRLVSRKELALSEARERIEKAIPEFQDIFGSMSYRPTVRYYEGPRGVKQILQDVLSTTKRTKAKKYRVYSSSGIRDLIAQAWPRYNATRKQNKVNVRAIALGAGGKTYGLDQRKWLTQKQSAPTYIFIYGDKTAYVSADEKSRLFGVIIDDKSISQTQKMIFDHLWRHLG